MAFINDFMSLIYPRYCEACEENLFRHEQFLCNGCLLNLPKSNYHLKKDTPLDQTFAGRIPAVNALSLYLYQKCGRVQNLLHALKYQQQKELAEYLGQLYSTDLNASEFAQQIDVITPVPLHPNKLKLRGYNQSEWFGKGLAAGLSKPLNTTILERTVDTTTQTKKKKFQRWENVDGIFKLKNSQGLANKHVLLVDDVITTGATIEAAWLALKSVEGVKISIASIAFAAVDV